MPLVPEEATNSSLIERKDDLDRNSTPLLYFVRTKHLFPWACFIGAPRLLTQVVSSILVSLMG